MIQRASDSRRFGSARRRVRDRVSARFPSRWLPLPVGTASAILRRARRSVAVASPASCRRATSLWEPRISSRSKAARSRRGPRPFSWGGMRTSPSASSRIPRASEFPPAAIGDAVSIDASEERGESPRTPLVEHPCTDGRGIVHIRFGSRGTPWRLSRRDPSPCSRGSRSRSGGTKFTAGLSSGVPDAAMSVRANSSKGTSVRKLLRSHARNPSRSRPSLFPRRPRRTCSHVSAK